MSIEQTVFDARRFKWIFLRLFTIELQVHLTLSALQAPAYIMSDSGFGSFVWIRSKTVISDEEAVIHIA